MVDVGESELKSKPGYAEVKQSCKLECDDGYFLCEKNKTCIYEHWRCDGVVDCSTSEDELNCTHYTKNDANSDFNKALEKGIKSCTKTGNVLKQILRNMTPEELKVISKAVSDYIKTKKDEYKTTYNTYYGK
ncbi:low-density lipoprotein receptor domain class A domain-containing protein [Ditylenchus destructor]|nr:low-density lipoprotein receptor domain class A domain-containing protein [Ditylenchus destructor]